MRRIPSQMILAIFLVLLPLAACQPRPAGAPTLAAKPTPAQPASTTQTTPPQPTQDIPIATETAPPTEAPSRAVFILPHQADPALGQQIQTVLQTSLGGAGISLETVSALTPPQIPEATRLIVSLGAVENLADLVAFSPQVQFLAVGGPSLPAAANLTSIRLPSARPDQAGFMAGVIGGMLTPDYRLGMLGLANDIPSKAAHNAFKHGLAYYCGMCQPRYPPFYLYPVFSTTSDENYLQSLSDAEIKFLYIFPGTWNEALAGFTSERGTLLIGESIPSEAVSAQWVASLGGDPLPAIASALPDLLAGQSAGEITVPLQILSSNASLFSPGRQQLAHEILADLLAGYIDTGVNLETGEEK